MSGTYSQIHIQAVFAVTNRESLIMKPWKDELFRYITGIIQNNGHKLLAINGMPDHVHIFFGMRPSQSLAGLMQDVKGSSSQWINKKRFVQGRFAWQEGYGAFSYGQASTKQVIAYIQNQELHHARKSFTEEYLHLLRQFGIEYEDRNLFRSVHY